MICPNISSPEWKALVDKVGENRAWKEFLIYGKIPAADNYQVSEAKEQTPVVFRSIRTRSTEDIAKGINKDLIRSQKDLKYTGHIMASVINTLGDISPNQKLTVKPADAFRTVKGIYTEVADNLKMALNGIISNDQDLAEVKASPSYEQILNEFPVIAYVNSYEDMVRAAETYETIVNEFDKYQDLVIAELARKGIRMRMDKNTVESLDPQDVAVQQADDTEDTEISQDEIGERYDKSVFETNPRDTASVRVKAFVQTIKTGEYEMGVPIYADPNDVFADILHAGSEMALTAYTEASGKLEAFRAALIKRVDARPYLKDVLTKLDNYEQRNQWEKINDILTFATKSFAQETLMLYKTRKDGNQVTGITDVKVINSNRDTVEDQVARQWLEAHKQSGFFSRNATGELKVKAEKLQRLAQIIEEGKTASGPAKVAKFKEFFSVLGIEFTDKDLEYIEPRLAKSLGKKDFDTLFISKNMLENIYTSYANNADQVFEDNYGFQDEKSSMRALASLYYEANPGRYNVASARTADGKQKYLYILTNFIEKKKRQWLSGQTASVTNSALGRPNKGFWDKVKQGLATFVPQYFNGIREQQAGKDGKVRKSLTDKEQAVTMLLKHQENLNTATYINFTLSDKTTTIETKMTKEFFVDSDSSPLGKGRDFSVNQKGELQYESSLVQRLFVAFAAPEISRILATIKYGNDVRVENFQLAGRLFYFIPSLNSNPALQEFRDDLYAGQMNMEQLYNKHYVTVGQAILEEMKQSTEDQIDQFLANGIIKNKDGVYTFPTSINGFKNTDYINRVRSTEVKGRDAARLMIMDMKLNYMNSQVKMIQFLRFDPAVAFKSFKEFNKSAQFSEISGADKVRLVSATWDEFSKRAAALIAPGSQGSYSWKLKDGSTYFAPEYNAVTAADVEYDINGTTNTITDAQEYVTVNEHIDGLMSEGKIPLKIWQSIYDKIEKAGPGGYYELSKEELGYVLTPTKPVQVNDANEAAAEAGLNRVDYVKSSRYPLIPQHEAGSERDKLRGWMERNNIRAVNFASGKKLGRPVKSVALFNQDGSEFIEPTADQWNAALQTLSREGLRTQQEIPHQKDEIRTVSQMNRTILDGMLDEMFSLKGIKEMTGSQAKTLKEQVRARLFEMQAERLQEKLGDLNRSHRGLHSLLKDIILNDTTGSYGENDLRSIELDPRTGKFMYPLEFQFKAKKFQGLINSLINKNVMLKVEGSSFIQVSGVGARYNFSGLSSGVKSDIIWTDSYAKSFKDGDVKLNYIRKEGDEVKPAQVIVSQYLRNSEGKLIDLSDYIKETKVGKTTVKILDTSKFSREMFELVGTRIPNQSHPSMLPIEVVGFLPSYMENTIIVPDGITGQMGSDFDVDKLYTYMSKIQEQDGAYTTVAYELNDLSDVEKLSEEQLGQLYRDIHWMALTHPAAYDKITKSVDMDEVKKKVAQRAATLAKYEIPASKGVMLPLDYMTSINRFNDNRSGKVGVGVFANLISAQADFQDKILRLGAVKDNQEEPNPIKIRLKKGKAPINLYYLGKPGSSTSFLGETRSISDNINMMFTESVDNAKNQYLREFNWTEKAMSAIGVFEMLTDEDGNAAPIDFVMDITSQNYIIELFTLIDQKQDSFGEYDNNALESSMMELQTKIAKNLVDQGYFNTEEQAGDYLSNKNDTRDDILDPDTLKDMWLVGKADQLPLGKREAALEKISKDMGMSVKDLMLKYNTVQYDSLMLFKRMEDIGRELNTILGGVYVYTKGIGSNVFATKQKLNQLNKLAMSTNFMGIDNIAGPISKNKTTGKIEIDPRGEIGAAIDKSLMVAQSIYDSLFPISGGQNIETIVDTLLENQGKKKDQLGREAYINLYDSVFNGIKAYMYTMPGLELFTNPREMRDKLINGDSSIGKRIMELVKDPEYKRNGFLKNIEVRQAPKQEAFTVSFKAPFGTDLDEKAIMSGFYELATSNKEEVRQLAKDLAIYPYLTGDAGSIGRFVPVDYLMGDADFNDMISVLDIVYSINMDQPGAMSRLITQIIQNNPEAFAKSFKYSTYVGSQGARDNVFKRVLKKWVGNAEDLSQVKEFSIKTGDFEADTQGANIAKSLRVEVSDRELKSLQELGINTSDVKFKYPPYILINDTFTSEFIEAGSRNVNYLYKRVSEIGDPVGRYERINILGYNGIQEYDFNNPELISAVKNNNNVEDDAAFVETVPPAAPIQQDLPTAASKQVQSNTVNQRVDALIQKGITILEQNGTYDVQDAEDGIIGEYITTLEEAVIIGEQYKRESQEQPPASANDPIIETKEQEPESLEEAEQGKELTPVRYSGTNYLAEGSAPDITFYYAKEDGSKGAEVRDAGLLRKVRMAHAVNLFPERVVTIMIGSKENSYYVIDDRIYSLQPSSYGDLITSEDVTNRVYQKANTKLEDKQSEGVIPAGPKPTFTYKGVTVTTEFKLSDEQSKALENIIDFVEGRVTGEGTYDGTYTLEGFAGTGKTSIIGILDRYISQKGKVTKFIYMAPTHAATVALGNNIVKYGAKELPMTVQSAVTESRDPMRPGPKFTKKFTDRATGLRNVVVLDEASMLANKDFDKVIAAAKAEGHKIIFMGDPKQIPEVITGAKTKELAKAFTNPNKSVLTSVFRTKDNNILTVLTNIRNNSDFVEYEFESTDNMKQLNRAAYNEELINDLQNNLEDVTIINYTNKGVSDINKAARDVLGHSGPLKAGEKIVGYLGSQTKQIEKGHLANSVSYMVSDVSVRDEGDVIISATSKSLQDLQKAGMRGFPAEVSFRYLQLSPNDSLNFELTPQQMEYNKNELKKPLKRIHELNELYQRKGISYGSYFVQVNAIRTEMADINTGSRYIYNPSNDLIELYDAQKHKGINPNLEMDKGVDFGYGITVHKSQGMTIPIVYFDTNSLSVVSDTTITRNGEKFNTEKNALYYVGMSRAATKLVVPKNIVGNYAEDRSAPQITDGVKPVVNNQEEMFDPIQLFIQQQTDEGIAEYTGELFGKDNTVTDYKGFLNKLLRVTSDTNKAILTAISKTGAIQPVTFKIDNNQKDMGVYDSSTRTITINPRLAAADAVDRLDIRNKIHEVIMHELVHHVTVDLLTADQAKLSPEQRKWVKAINNLYDQVQQKVLDDPNHADNLLMALSTVNGEGFLSATDKSLYYGLTSVYDFVTMMMTDKGFQQFMNNIEFAGEKTILQRFMDLVVSLIKSLGIQVKDNSVLNEGLKNIIGLLESRGPASETSTVQKSPAIQAANKEYIAANFETIVNVLNIKTKC